MPVPTLVTDLSTTLASNSPAGSDNVFPSLDDYLRSLSGFIASIRDNSGNGWVSPYLPLAGGTVTGATIFSSTVALNGALSGTGLTTYLASPPAIGGTTPAAGSFTTLSASSSVTLSGGTANGVLYLNASKVATSGAAITFDGTNFATTGSATATAFIPSGSSVPTNGMYLPAANTVAWSTNTTERARITSGGDFGIGTTSPAQKLDVSAAGAAAIRVSSSDGTSAALELVRVGAGGDYRFRNAGGVLFIDYGTNDSSFATLVSQFSSGGAIGVGTNAASSGSGITFPATQSASSDANTLDDYEEGTWTPSLGGTATYTTQSGFYTKVGRQVTIWADLTVSSIGSGSTSQISGAPFTPAAGITYMPGSVYWENLALSETSLIALIQGSSGTIWFAGRPTSATSIDNVVAIFGNSARVRFCITYNV